MIPLVKLAQVFSMAVSIATARPCQEDGAITYLTWGTLSKPQSCSAPQPGSFGYRFWKGQA